MSHSRSISGFLCETLRLPLRTFAVKDFYHKGRKGAFVLHAIAVRASFQYRKPSLSAFHCVGRIFLDFHDE